MKKAIVLIYAIALFTGAFAQKKTLTIDTVLSNVAKEIAESEGIKEKNKNLAVSNFKSDTKDLSDYLQRQLSDELAKNKNAYQFVERDTTIIDKEIDYQQFSGNVDERTIVNLGKRLSANVVVYGEFSQLTEIPILTVRAVDVESSKNLFINQYDVSDSQSLRKLLGDKKALNDANDYMVLLSEYKRKIAQIESDKNTEIAIETGKINQKYQFKINSIWDDNPSKVKEKWNFDKKQSYIKENKFELERKRDTELEGFEKTCNAKYDDLLKRINIQEAKTLTDLSMKTFELKGNSVIVGIGEYVFEKTDQKLSESQFFPINIKASIKGILNYEKEFHKKINLDTDEEEFLEIEDARLKNAFVGSVSYKLSQDVNDINTFNVIVTQVTVTNSKTGRNLINETPNEPCGVMKRELPKFTTSQSSSSSEMDVSSTQEGFSQPKVASNKSTSSSSSSPSSKTMIAQSSTSSSSSSSHTYSDSASYSKKKASRYFNDYNFLGVKAAYSYSDFDVYGYNKFSAQGVNIAIPIVDVRKLFTFQASAEYSYLVTSLTDEDLTYHVLDFIFHGGISFGERLALSTGAGFGLIWENANNGQNTSQSFFEFCFPVELDFRLSNRWFLFGEYAYNMPISEGHLSIHSFRVGLEFFTISFEG